MNGIPNSISGDNLESTVTYVLSKATKFVFKATFNVYVLEDDIEACHRISIYKSNGNSKKTTIHFINSTHCKCAVVNNKKLKFFKCDEHRITQLVMHSDKNWA